MSTNRWRVACAFATLMYVPGRPTIMIHDYTRRKEYHVVEEYIEHLTNTRTHMAHTHTQHTLTAHSPHTRSHVRFMDKIEIRDALAVFIPKMSIDRDRLRTRLLEYIHAPL